MHFFTIAPEPDFSFRIEPWPNGPEAFRAVFLDGSYTGAASVIGAARA